jgi:hypothetical protein
MRLYSMHYRVGIISIMIDFMQCSLLEIIECLHESG